MTSDLHRAFMALAAIDRRLRASVGGGRSLDPVGRFATSLVALVEKVGAGATDDELCALARCIEAIAAAQLESFPGNLFHDFDLMTASVFREAAVHPGGRVAGLAEAARVLVEVHHLFGRRTPIRFRYVHDFVYGFDWARWVARDPASRQRIGPYDRPFLASILERGGQLLALIEANDAEYPPLPSGVDRNPFAFERGPDDERRLLESLAADGLVPVRAWRLDEEPRWDLPFGRLRRERARELGLAKSPEPAHGEKR